MIPSHRLIKKIAIPQNVKIELGEDLLVSGPKGALRKNFAHPATLLKIEGNELVLSPKTSSKKTKRMINTFRAHIKNMILGVTEGFNYKLKICSSHFPMSVAVEGGAVVIKNFFGEKIPRKAKILSGVKVDIKGDIINVDGLDVASVSQTAANIETATRRTGFDRRVFNDGIWMTEKAGKKFK
ncbi:50S ribosomal protein L6 [Candidatus Woesearchaeota archaeon]|nr:50S ribosomal protein L6 [Candidatus Woesearchaeota archaeon]